MKHEHSDINVKVDIPTEDLEDLVDTITNSAITIIVVATAAHILKKWAA